MRRRLKASARSLTFQIAVGFWALLFVLAGRLLRPGPRKLKVTGRDRVLVLAPHPDDETLGCGGTMLQHTRGGDRLCVLIVTDGGGSRAGGLSREEMVRERSAEVARAMFTVAPDAQVVQLALPEGQWSEDNLRGPLAQLLKTFDPTVIYAPSCVDYHPEHVRVAQALADTLMGVEQINLRAVRIYEVQVPLTPVLVNLISDMGEFMTEKRSALRSYRTQAMSLGTRRGMFGWPSRHASYLRILYRAKGYVEAFWEVTPAQYVTVMGRGLKEQARFRGLRSRPFTDGLAWVVGWRERAQISAGCARSAYLGDRN